MYNSLTGAIQLVLEMQRCRCGLKTSIRLEIKLGEVWRNTIKRCRQQQEGIGHLPVHWEQREDQEQGEGQS